MATLQNNNLPYCQQKDEFGTLIALSQLKGRSGVFKLRFSETWR